MEKKVRVSRKPIAKGITEVTASKNEVNETNKVSIIPAVEIPAIPAKETVKVLLRVIQQGQPNKKHPELEGKTTFTMETAVHAYKDNITVSGLAKKVAYGLADALFRFAENAIIAREQNGYYLTSFRPKAVFKVYIIINGICHFMAVNTKGSDSIRLFKAGKMVSRGVLVQKFALLAEVANASKTFGEVVSFELDVEKSLAFVQRKEIEIIGIGWDTKEENRLSQQG